MFYKTLRLRALRRGRSVAVRAARAGVACSVFFDQTRHVLVPLSLHLTLLVTHESPSIDIPDDQVPDREALVLSAILLLSPPNFL